MSSIQVIFIRHAEASNSWGNHPDPGLSDNGKNQSKELINHPELIKLDDYFFISSPKLRAIETAKPLAEKFEKEVFIENIFTEIPSPDVEPENKQEWLKGIIQMDKKDLPKKILNWKNNIFLNTKMLSQNTVIFTHFMVMNALLSELTSNANLLYFNPDYTSVLKITIENKEFKNFSTERGKKTSINL